MNKRIIRSRAFGAMLLALISITLYQGRIFSDILRSGIGFLEMHIGNLHRQNNAEKSTCDAEDDVDGLLYNSKLVDLLLEQVMDRVYTT